MGRQIALLLLSTCLAATALAQGFERSPFLQITGGVGFPAGAASGDFGYGPAVMVELGTPLQATVLTSVQFSYHAPSIDNPDASSSITGFAAVLRIPFSPDAGTTGFLLGSLGGFDQEVTLKKTSASSKWKLGFDVGLGFLFAPENWRAIYLDVEARYRRIYITGDGWEDIGIFGGVGLHLM